MTPEAQALVKLAERCEAATGADRELDGAIFAAISGVDSGFVACGPGYTASLDAAMSLVPEGRFVGELNQCDVDGEWYARIEAHDAVYQDAVAATPALVLTAASLRALASLEKLERVE